MNHRVVTTIVAIVLIFLSFLLLDSVRKSHVNEINAWAVKNEISVRSIEFPLFATGPYILRPKGAFTIAEVSMSNGRTYWFRFNLFSTDVEEYK